MFIKKQIFSFLLFCGILLSQTKGSFASEINRCVIPPDIASVNAVSDYSSEKLVYYIHDAHCQPEAQYTIAKLIEKIIAHHGDAVVAVEGAQGQFKADIFRNFPDKKALANVAGSFVENGSISGAEYLFLTSRENISLVGAENCDSYIDNYECMTDLLKIQKSAVRSIEYLIDESLLMSKKILSGDQNKFIQNWSGYKKGELELKNFTLYLSGIYINRGHDFNEFGEIEKYLNACRLEENIKIDTVESERLAFFDWFTARADKDDLAGLFTSDLNFQLKKITPKEYFTYITDLAEKNGYNVALLEKIVSYNNYLHMVSSLDSVVFHSQLKECVNAVKTELFSLEKESNLIKYLSALYDIKSLVGLHITNADLGDLPQYDDISEIKLLTSIIFQSDLTTEVNWHVLEQAHNLGVNFYDAARTRDAFMVANLLDEMEVKNCSVGIIIAGGFHQKGICSNLNGNKINFVSVKPSLMKIKDNNRYIALIRNIKTPLERWASDSTLAVASWLSENPLINPSAKQVKTVVFSSMLVSAAIKNMVPNDLVLLRSNLSDFMDRAQLYLDAWMKQYAPQIKLNNLVMIKDRFAVEILVNGREIIFLFDTIDSQGQDLPVSENKILEKNQFGDDSVTVVTHEIAEQLRLLALIEQRINRVNEGQDGIEKLFKDFGLVNQYKSNKLTLTNFVNKVNELSRSGVEVSLKDYYTALRWMIQNQSDLFTSDDIANITTRNEQLFENFDFNLKPSDINSLAYQFLRQVNSGDAMLSVSDFPSAWYQILNFKGVDSITFQHDIPYEAVVRMLFDILLQPTQQPGIVNLGNLNGKGYQARNIKLADGGVIVRIVAQTEPSVSGESSIDNPFETDGGESEDANQVKDGILLIERDGGFILSNMLAFDVDSAELSYTDIRNNSVSLKRGDSAESFLRNFIENIMRTSMQRGFVSRGIIFRDQGREPQYFADKEQFIDYMRNELSGKYVPVRQTNWAGSAGRLTEKQMVDLMKRDIILGDLEGGYEHFQAIEALIDLKGKRVLDVGSQLGYNVFYAHLKGAEFAVGVDINPYQQQAAREISAYLQDNIHDKTQRVDEQISSLVVAPEGTTHGQLFFRTLDLKEYEEANNVSLAVKPPDNIEFSIADARSLPYEDDSFDVVSSEYLLPYITNPSTALAEMIRVTQTGGLIKFNYSFSKKTDALILEEACSILARKHNLQIGYIISSVQNEKHMLLQITSKQKIGDNLNAQSANMLQFTNKSSQLPNSFDAKPYLSSIYPPISALPVNYNTLSTAPIDSLNSIPGITGRDQVALAFTKQMLDRLYNREIYGAVSTVEISRGASELVSVLDDTLVIDESALSNPYILFSLVEQTLVNRFINSLPDEFFYKHQIPAESISFYKDVIFVQFFPQQLLERFSTNQVKQITAVLRGAEEKDTALEFQADMLGRILEQSLDKTMSTKKLIYEVLSQTLDLPEYKHLKTSSDDLGALFDDGVVSLFAIEQIENLSWQVKNLFKSSYFKRDFAFEFLSPEILEQAAGSVNPSISIKEYLNFLPYLKTIDQLGTTIPDNLSDLLADEMFNEIMQKYPAVGFYVLKDLIKTVVNDPENPAHALFLTELDSIQIMAVIQNISKSINEKLPSFENGVEHALPILESMPATAWIGPRLHTRLIEMNQGEAYRVLNMQLKTDEEDIFLKKLNDLTILNDVQDNELVALKITRDTVKDGGKALDVFIVVDTLEGIRSNSQLVAGFSTFMEHEMSYKKTFSLPVNATKESFISFSTELQSAGGVGSEFMRNEIALFQRAGMANAAVNAVSKEIRVYSMIEREINADMVIDLFWDRILPEPRQAQELAALFYRIGVLDRSQLDQLWDLATSEDDVLNEMKSIFTQAVEQSTKQGETFLKMFNRKNRAFIRKKARLSEIQAIYSRLANDPFVTMNYPEIRDQYRVFQSYKDLAIETPVYNMEPLTLGMESDLIDRIPEFEEDLLSYVKTDILSNVVIPNSLFVSSTDLSETYGEFASYVSRILPFVDLRGAIPSEIREDNINAHISLFFRTAEHLSAYRTPEEISEILQSDNVMDQLANDISAAKKGTVIKQALQGLFTSLLQEKTLSANTLKAYFSFFKNKGLFDGELLDDSGQWTVNVIKTNPEGAGVVFFSLASLFLDNPRESMELFSRLIAIQGADFVDLVQYASLVNAETFLNELSDILTLFESGLRDRIQSLNGIGGETFGRLNLLFANNSVILPDILDSSKFAIQIKERQADENGFFIDGFSSLELAGTLFDWLTKKGVEAALMKGDSIVSGEEQFFLRIGTINVGISPFADFINPDYKSITSVDSSEFKEAYDDNRSFVPLTENQPLLWRNLNKQLETYYTGKLQSFIADGISYIDFTIESNIRNGDGTLSSQTGVLRVPTANLFDLYESVTSIHPDKALLSISNFKHANLSFSSTSDDIDTASFRANYFNDIFYQVISRMEPMWMFSEKVNNAVDVYSRYDAGPLAGKMVLSQYVGLPSMAQQQLINQQLIEQDETAEFNSDRLHAFNSVRPDFSVILIDSFPVGWVIGQEIYLADPLKHAKLYLSKKIAKKEGHSFSPFIKNSEKTSFTNIAFFASTEYGAIEGDLAPAVPAKLFDSAYYKQELARALLNAGFKIKDMFEQNVSVQLVQDHWRLGDRQFNNVEGTTVLIIDIDAFRDPFLLEFVLRHELVPHQGAGGEAYALLKDIFGFRNLSGERQQQLLDILRDDNIDMQNFADILEKSKEDFSLDIINDIIAYISDPDKYPQLSLELKGMSEDEVYRYLSHQLNDQLSLRLESMELNSLDVLKLTMHPQFNDLSLALDTIDRLEENPVFPKTARQNVFSYLLDNKLDADDIAEAFYNMDIYDTAFSDLFVLFGPEIVPVLFKNTQGNEEKIQLFEQFMITFGRSFGDVFSYSINPFAQDQYLKIVIETGSENIEWFYRQDGSLYIENIYDHVDWYSVVPEQTEQMAVMCEEFFGKNLENAITIMNGFLERIDTASQTDASIQKDMDELIKLVSRMMDDYRTVKLAKRYLDLRNIPLSKQELSIEINTQFVSDLVGSPITFGLGMIQLAEFELRETPAGKEINYDEVVRLINQAHEGLTRVRQMLIQYRIMKDYRIALNDGSRMIKFDWSMDLDINSPIRDQEFYPESAVADQIKSRMSSENDVYAVYFSGQETNSIKFISDIMDKLDAEQPARIVVVSPQLDTDVVESLLSEFNIAQAAVLILGKDILSKSETQTVSGSDIVSMIQDNVDNPPDNVIFLSDQARVFSDLMREGLTVLPLPDIKRTPKPYSPSLGRKAIIDQAA